jgi:hypothetical protein
MSTDDQILNLLEGLIEGRNDFFTRTMQLTPHQHRSNVLSRFLLNEVCYIELINRIQVRGTSSNTRSAVVTFTLPSNFSDPVLVTPTQNQISQSVQDIGTSLNNCAICQDSISSGGVKIRQCGHDFHRSCLMNWFALSVRCPVCRHDIRDLTTQTQPVLEQTSSQPEDQSEENDTSE